MTGENPGCPVIVWDGPYKYRCALGASVGECAYHGTFNPPTPDAGAGDTTGEQS